MTDRVFDPTVIIQAAESKLSQEGDLEGAVLLFQSSLLEWGDEAREQQRDPEQMREAIATLWIGYAQFLIRAQQFKSATEAYEQAVQDPISASVGRVWLEYARFAEDRNKLRSAQQIYLRALVGNAQDSKQAQSPAVSDEQDQDILWSCFLEMMQRSNPELTMADLRKAVEEEHGGGLLARGSASPMPMDSPSLSAPAAKRPRLDAQVAIKQEEDDPFAGPSRTHVVTPGDVEIEHQALLDITLQSHPNKDGTAPPDPEFVASWMARDGTAPPQAPEPPLFGPSPPKLSDPTGKDLLGGEELALAIIERLLEPTGKIVLEVCRGLWMWTALTEKLSNEALSRLDDTVSREAAKLEERLNERLSVAGAAEAAVRQLNENERQTFHSACNQQRQTVLDSIAWDFRHLLWVQQQMLTKLKVPGFSGTTVDASDLEFQSKICSFLHSAFYLRKRVGEQSHQKMLKSQADRLKQSGVTAGAVLPPSSTSTGAQPQAGMMQPPPSQAGAQQFSGRYSPVPPTYGGGTVMPGPMHLPPPPTYAPPYGTAPYNSMASGYGGGPPPPGPPHQYNGSMMYPPSHPRR